jgi:hypothetical protein
MVYIAPSGWEETFFWNLANQLEHEYSVYYCETNGEHPEPEQNSLILDPTEFFDFYQKIND